MSILSDTEIENAYDAGRLKIDPFRLTQVQPASYDLRLGHHFREYITSDRRPIDPRSPERRTKLDVLRGAEVKTIRARSFLLASTEEYISLPDDIVGRVEGKSSLARMGLFVHVTAGFIDPGFDGHLTLELFNANHLPIQLIPGMKVCQISFEKLNTPAARPYGKGAYGSKYSGQSEGPVESMYYKNFG